MTSSDKTGEKLVASIRKSKTSTASAGDKSAAEKTTGRQTTSRAQAGSRNTPAASAGTSDAFGFGRRVWPD